MFAPLRAALAPFRAFDRWPPLEAWNAAVPEGLASVAGAPIRFVPQPPKRRRGQRFELAEIYDERIFVRGEVPSRTESWHDFFNMLAWLSFPSLKRAVNARQRAALRARVDEHARTLPGARTAEQDALAMLDEGGLLLAVREGVRLDEAIARADVDAIAAAVARKEARALLLGHAIYEHLVLSTSLVRALVFPVTLPRVDDIEACRVAVDASVATALLAGVSPRAEKSVPGLPVIDALFLG